MTRDMDLIRRIALATAALPHGQALTGLEGVDPADFSIHVIWMVEAGLLSAIVQEFQSDSPPAVFVRRLTWQGCEFADAVANDTLWNKAKEAVIKPSASWSFSLLTEWLKAEITQGFPTLRG